MKYGSRSKTSSLFLLELIFAILFFSVASAVCVQIFVRAHLIASESRELDRASHEVSGAAELIGSAADTEELTDLLETAYSSFAILYDSYDLTRPWLPDDTLGDGSQAAVYYDKDFSLCEEDEAVYAMQFSFSLEGSLLKADLSFLRTRDGESVYVLSLSHYMSGEVADHA